MVLSASEYSEFQKLLHNKTGILLGDNKQYLVSSRLSAYLKENSLESFGDLLKVLARPGSNVLLQQVIDRMTTNETLWFRDGFPFSYLMSHIMPELKSKGQSRANIWCAACSSGQEPYSISIALEEAYSGALRHKIPAQVDILATDISSRILKQAQRAEYQPLEITRGLSPERQKRFFEQSSTGSFLLKPELKKRVKYMTLNLMQLPYRSINRYDVIYCRNVLIYFSAELKIQVIKGMADCLKPGGYFFLGASESMPSSIPGFEMVRCNPGLVYRKK